MTKQGGSRPGSGAKKLPPGERKIQVSLNLVQDYIFEWAKLVDSNFAGDLKAAKKIVREDLTEMFSREYNKKLVASWGKDTASAV